MLTFFSVFAYWLWWSISIRFMWVMPKKGPKSQRIIYWPCSKSGPICALTLSHTAHYLGRYAQKHELKRAARITIEQCCGTYGLGLCRRYWPFCGWAHLVKVVYMSSKILNTPYLTDSNIVFIHKLELGQVHMAKKYLRFSSMQEVGYFYYWICEFSQNC